MRTSFPKTLRANFTVEAAIIVPMLLTIFAIIITLLFYYHDKNVVAAIAHETVVMGCGKEEITDAELEQYFQKRIRRKVLLFSTINAEAEVKEDRIVMTCLASKKRMTLKSQMSMSRTEPVHDIRKLRRLDRIKEQIGEIE